MPRKVLQGEDIGDLISLFEKYHSRDIFQIQKLDETDPESDNVLMAEVKYIGSIGKSNQLKTDKSYLLTECIPRDKILYEYFVEHYKCNLTHLNKDQIYYLNISMEGDNLYLAVLLDDNNNENYYVMHNSETVDVELMEFIMNNF